MARFKIILLGVLSACALSAASAAPALADPTEINATHCSTGTVTVLCLVLSTEPNVLWEQNQAGEWAFVDELKLTPAATVSVLSVEGGPVISCKLGESSFTLDTTVELTLSLNVLNVTITFDECEVTNSAETKANCLVKEPIVTSAEGSIDLPENDVLFKPIPPSTVFATITIKSVTGKTCIFAKENQKVTGEQLCEFPLESETELTPEVELDAVTHFLNCTAAGSKLLYAEKNATFTLEDEIKIAKGGEWDLTTG
jgi:hypothetical protein